MSSKKVLDVLERACTTATNYVLSRFVMTNLVFMKITTTYSHLMFFDASELP